MEDKDTTYAELSDYYEVPCANEEGETVWRRIEAVTQHPVINEDGSNTMLKVTTRGCREITATKAKSFLQLIDGKIQPVNGKDLNVGDYLPVSRKPLDYTEIHTLDLKTILSPTEYIYGSEFKKACEVMVEYQWWKKHANKTFTLPYARSDSVVAAFHNSDQCAYNNGFVYTKRNSICNYLIPETITMDYDFGYLLGAYVAEGCVTRHQISIANNDPVFFEPIIRLCEKWNLTYKMYKHASFAERLSDTTQNSDSLSRIPKDGIAVQGGDPFRGLGPKGNSSTDEEKIRNIAKQQIVTKICGYKSQDMKNGLFDPEKFVNLEYVMNLLQMSQMKCFYCKEMVQVLYEHVREPRQWTLDRLENDQGHNKSNVIIACLNCNLRRRCMYHERYVFTKQLNVKLCDNL
jgi:hypothetical protein